MPYYTDRKLVLRRLASGALSVGIFIYLMVDNGLFFDRGTTGVFLSVFVLLCFGFILFGFAATVVIYFKTGPRISVMGGNLTVRQALLNKAMSFPADELLAVELVSGRKKYIRLKFKDAAKSFQQFQKSTAGPEPVNNGAIAKNGLRMSLAYMDINFDKLKSELEAGLSCDVLIV